MRGLTATPMQVGVYGKLPCNGDFLRRRVPQDFLDWWDGWLQAGVQASREELGASWLDCFLTSPAWRFYFDADPGARACAGLLVPSVDRVGRYFPLTLMWFPRGGRTVFSLARQAAPWFDAAERLVVQAMEAQRLDFESFDRQVCDDAALLNAIDGPDEFGLAPESTAQVLSPGAGGWQMPLSSVPEMRAVAEHLAGSMLRQSGKRCYFWSEGSDRVAPSLLISARAPAARDYASLLTGQWNASAWHALPASLHVPARTSPGVARSTVPLRFESAADTHAGHARSENQDALLERAEAGLWVVADGMGGHSDGQLASRMTCDALVDVLAPPAIDPAVELVRDRLQAVNDYLFRMASRAVDPRQCGSTVVALLVREGQSAVLWAGDSRAYRLRGGQLQQLSVDHSWSSPGAGAGEGTAITRAVGGSAELELDAVLDEVLPGDRFLLCSDGVTRELDDTRLHELLAAGDAQACCRALMRAVLATAARDNATVVVIDARLVNTGATA